LAFPSELKALLSNRSFSFLFNHFLLPSTVLLLFLDCILFWFLLFLDSSSFDAIFEWKLPFPIEQWLTLLSASSAENRESLYAFLVRFHFDNLVRYWRHIPPYLESFDLISRIPIDGAGCSSAYFPSLLDRAHLFPNPVTSLPRRRLCIFLMLLHTNATHVDRFIARLNGDDFLFALTIDARQSGLHSELASRYARNPNVFIALPAVEMCWACTSLNYGPWVAISAVLKHGFRADWFSLHSGTDAVLHSREITKQFLLRYRDTAEFVWSWPAVPGRVRQLHTSSGGCRPQKWLVEAREAMRHVFPNWTALPLAQFRGGSQWWTVSQRAIEGIMRYMKKNPLFVLRLSFLAGSDEAWMQTLMNAVGLSVNQSCFLRSLFFPPSAMHPNDLTNATIARAMTQFSLFARKMPAADESVAAFLEDRVAREGNQLPRTLVVARNSTVCGFRKWAQVLKQYRAQSRSN
jgi:hypothetical protein